MMEFESEDIKQEFNRVESSIKRFMKKQYWWIEDLSIDKDSFEKSKKSHSKIKKYKLNLVIDIKNIEWLKENEGDLDRAEEQLQLLFNNVLESLSSFDITKPSFAMLDLTPVIQGSMQNDRKREKNSNSKIC